MSRLAAQLTDLAIAHFPAALLPPGGGERLRVVAPHLAPATPLYFECRLGEGEAIDVSQHFFRTEDGARRLQGLADRRLAAVYGRAAEAWRRIAGLAAWWGRDDALARQIVEIGLEYDASPAGGIEPVPALFAAFADGVLPNRRAVEAFVDLLLPAGSTAWPRLVAVLEIAEARGMQAGRMVGLMMSRDGEMRSMIRRLSPEAVRSLLEEAGWAGDIGHLASLLSLPVMRTDAARLVLGFAPDLVPACGIEIIHSLGAEGRAATAALLDWLVAEGLARPDRSRALGEWQGQLTPLEARAPWPDALIARDITGPADRFTVLNRFVNHVKLNLSQGAIVAVKAYLTLQEVERYAAEAGHA